MKNKNKTPVLFFDFDGFKFDTFQIHIEYINQKYHIETVESDYIGNPHLDLVINKYLPKNKHVSYGFVYEDIGKNLLGSVDWHNKVKPMKDMVTVVKNLSKKYDIITVTARQKSSLNVIEYLINKYIPECISDIHCVWEHLGSGKFKEYSKKEFILNHQGEKVGFFDDSPKEILPLCDHLPSYLFDPKGLHDENKQIKNRVRSWKEIENLLL